MRSERERLLDILEAIERIEKYAEEGKDTFEADELIQTWIVHHITILLLGKLAAPCLMIFRQGIQTCPGQILSRCAIFLSIITSGSIQMLSGRWLSATCLS